MCWSNVRNLECPWSVMVDKPVMIGLTPTIVVDNRFHVIVVIAITPADNTDGGVAATANIDIPMSLD